MTSIFKAYDIRGKYPEHINEDLAYRLGRALVTYLKASRIVVGRGARPSTPALFENFAQGIIDQGCDVVDIGVVTTPMVYYASGVIKSDGAVSITASHNPPEYNGFKLNKGNAIPIGKNSGMEDIRLLTENNNFPETKTKGTLHKEDIKDRYLDYISSFTNFGDSKFTIVVDPANSMGVLDLPFFEKLSDNIDLIPICDKLDMGHAKHTANPLKAGVLDDLKRSVVENNANLGIALDGDADRIVFIDEKGDIVRADFITALLAKNILQDNPGAKILYDLRSSKIVLETIIQYGGTPIETPVGHAYIKKSMRENDAIFAGELSGHYYFKENFNAESAMYAAVLILNLMSDKKLPLSKLIKQFQKYFQSGEISIEVKDKQKTLNSLKKIYKDGKCELLDGVKISYEDWWFNTRASNTEPLLRLNIEADNQNLLELKKIEILETIKNIG